MNGRSESIWNLSKKWFVAHRYKKDPKFTSKELEFIGDYLDEMEQVLFFQMAPVDQRHAFEVAREVATDPRIQTADERILLVKAGLLHDIGKVKGDFTITQRVLVKLMKKFLPGTYRKLASQYQKPGTLTHAVFVQAAHPKRGAYMLQAFGASELVVELVKNHHETPKSRFARLLREADNLH